MSTISSNMGLLISSIGTDSGLLWEQNLNTSLTTIDGHNHSAGSGVQIQPSGMLINSNLSFGNNAATNLQSTVYTAQSGFTTRQAVYVSGVDLYYNDGSGNAVQITSGGLVNATSSGLSGSGGATAAFVTGVLVVNGAASTPGNIKGGSVLIGNNSVGSKFCTVQAPAALASNYNLILPAGYPGSTGFVQMDTAGNLAASIAVSQGITRTNLASVGQQVSSSSGTFVGSLTASYQAITNLTVTITTTGRPVMLMAQSDGTAGATQNGAALASSVNAVTIAWFRGATNISQVTLPQNTSGSAQVVATPGAINFLDTPSANTYTYTLKFISAGTASGILEAENIVIVAYEL